MTLRGTVLTLFLLVLSLLAVVTSSLGQTETATLSGLITDPQGKVVPSVAVEVTNVDTNVSVHQTTNNAGLYVVVGLKPGRYRVSVTKDGFRRIDLTDLVLNVQDAISRNFQLQLGPVLASITVVADSGKVQTDPGVSTVVGRQFVGDLPLNGRSFNTLIELTPGVILAKTNSLSQGQFSVNGQRTDANYYMVDGVSANVGVTPGFAVGQFAAGALPALGATGGTNGLVSVDALQEFRVQTSSFAPEFGRTPGAQISLATRSGTNEFHGTVFDYFRNDALDATDWFANNKGLKKPALRQNDFGGTVGGPLIKDHLFFFFSYEGLRLRQPRVTLIEVPSSQARQSAAAGVQPFLDAFPQPNGTDFGSGVAQFSASYSDPTTLDAASLRLDYDPTSKLNLFIRYNYAPSSATIRGGSGTTLSVLAPTKSTITTLTTGTTLSFGPRVVNSLRVNWSRVIGTESFRADTFGGAVPVPDSLLAPAFSQNHDQFGFLIENLIRLWGTGSSSQNVQRQFNLIDTVDLVRGAHQLKFGVDYRRLTPVTSALALAVLADFPDVVQASTGVAPFVGVSAQDQIGLLYTNLSFFGQDTWRVTPRLSLTYGLRWDYNPPPSGADGKDLFTVSGFSDPSTWTLAPKGTPLWKATHNNFAPRIGIALDLVQSQRWGSVVRGGFGIFHDLGNAPTGGKIHDWPYFRLGAFFDQPVPIDPAVVVPPPFSLNLPVTQLVVFDPNLRLPRTYQWNVAFEQMLGVHQALSLTYLGAVGRRLQRAAQVTSPNTDFQGGFTAEKDDASSDYHALQMQFQRRLTRGLQALASYTWSHSIDTASDDATVELLDTANGALPRGPSTFDVRHSATAAITYQLPRPQLGHMSLALADWSVDGVFRVRSPDPVDVVATTGITPSGVFIAVRPDVVPGVPFYLYGSSFPGGKAINGAAFVPPPSGMQGNLGKNALRGFGAWQLDLGLGREFKLTDRLKVRFKAEFFNLFNHPNFGDPTSLGHQATLNGPNFGVATQMLGQSLGAGGDSGGFNPLYQIGGPRSTQLSLRLLF